MLSATISPLLLADFRIFGAAILFWILSLTGPREHVTNKDKLLLAGAGALSIVCNQGCYVFGVGLTSPAEASIITTSMPIWVMFLAAIILKEPITLKKIGGIVVGATGALILIIGTSSSIANHGDKPWLGDLLVLIAQLSYALYLTLYKNFIKKYSTVTLMKWMFLFSSIFLIFPSFETITSTKWSEFTINETIGALYVVVFGTFIAYLMMMKGQKILRPTIVGMYNYLQPIVASIVAISLGLDHFTPVKILAVLLIFSGVALVINSKSRSAKT